MPVRMLHDRMPCTAKLLCSSRDRRGSHLHVKVRLAARVLLVAPAGGARTAACVAPALLPPHVLLLQCLQHPASGPWYPCCRVKGKACSLSQALISRTCSRTSWLRAGWELLRCASFRARSTCCPNVARRRRWYSACWLLSVSATAPGSTGPPSWRPPHAVKHFMLPCIVIAASSAGLAALTSVHLLTRCINAASIKPVRIFPPLLLSVAFVLAIAWL